MIACYGTNLFPQRMDVRLEFGDVHSPPWYSAPLLSCHSCRLPSSFDALTYSPLAHSSHYYILLLLFLFLFPGTLSDCLLSKAMFARWQI